jgi:hypothetical protein
MDGASSTNGEKRNAYRILVGKPEECRPLGRPTRRLADSVKIGLKRDRMGWCGLYRCVSGWRPVESCCEQGNEASVSIEFWEVLE